MRFLSEKMKSLFLVGMSLSLMLGCAGVSEKRDRLPSSFNVENHYQKEMITERILNRSDGP